MKIIVDTNIIIGVLIKRSYLLFEFLKVCKNFEVVSPDYVRKELLSKVYKISKLSKLSENEVQFAISVLLDYVRVIPTHIYRDKIFEAKEISKEFDYKDYPFIALALKLNAPIWTGDKNMIVHSLRSGKYIALDTQAVEELIKGKDIEVIKENLRRRYLTE